MVYNKARQPNHIVKNIRTGTTLNKEQPTLSHKVFLERIKL